MEDGWLLNKRMKDNTITVTRNGDKKQLARHHLSDLLRSLNCEQDRRRTAQLRLDSALSLAISFDQTFHMLHVRHMMCMCIPIVSSI